MAQSSTSYREAAQMEQLDVKDSDTSTQLVWYEANRTWSFWWSIWGIRDQQKVGLFSYLLFEWGEKC